MCAGPSSSRRDPSPTKVTENQQNIIVPVIEQGKMAATPAEQSVFLNRSREKANALGNYRVGFLMSRKLVAARQPENLTPLRIDTVLVKAVTTNFFAGKAGGNSHSPVYKTQAVLQADSTLRDNPTLAGGQASVALLVQMDQYHRPSE